MEVLKFTIAAGESKRFEKAGRYIEIIEADQALSLFFYDENGGQSDDAQGVVSGLFIEGRYSSFVVSSVQAQTVTLLLSDGRGGSRRQPGNVSIIDAVSPACQTVNVAVLTLGFTATAIVLPAANVAGLLLRMSLCAAEGGSGGTATVRLVAASSAPASIIPGAQSIVLNNAFSSALGQIGQSQALEMRRRIPAGWGLYSLTNHTGVAANGGTSLVSFELI